MKGALLSLKQCDASIVAEGVVLRFKRKSAQKFIKEAFGILIFCPAFFALANELLSLRARTAGRGNPIIWIATSLRFSR